MKLQLLCGRPDKELIYAEQGYDATVKKGAAWSGWALPVYYARSDNEEVEIELTVPKKAAGLLRVFVIDPDNFEGGRKEKVVIAEDELQPIDNFQEGKWLEHRVTGDQTVDGKVVVRVLNARNGSNAVVSLIEWVDK